MSLLVQVSSSEAGLESFSMFSVCRVAWPELFCTYFCHWSCIGIVIPFVTVLAWLSCAIVKARFRPLYRQQKLQHHSSSEYPTDWACHVPWSCRSSRSPSGFHHSRGDGSSNQALLDLQPSCRRLDQVQKLVTFLFSLSSFTTRTLDSLCNLSLSFLHLIFLVWQDVGIAVRRKEAYSRSMERTLWWIFLGDSFAESIVESESV